MITKRIVAVLTIFVLLVLVNCSKNHSSEQLSAEELALLSEIESATAGSAQDESTAKLPPPPSAQPKKSTSRSNIVVEIKEKMFIAQTNDIYINKDGYLGKTIKYEGLFDQSTWRDNGKVYRYVVRLGPGCCPGDVSAAGFEVVWDKGYPHKNDWVEAVGVLEEYDDDGLPTLRLALSSLNVLAKRGKERVTQ
jgi:putative membrane protein